MDDDDDDDDDDDGGLTVGLSSATDVDGGDPSVRQRNSAAKTATDHHQVYRIPKGCNTHHLVHPYSLGFPEPDLLIGGGPLAGGI